ncbi:MAG: SpaH/EbpB family LPXTG-anchored major pilin [Oscillospiraceae bacterium]
MKLAKKLASVLLALVMALALAVPALAAGDTYSITINNSAAGHTYEAYQIFIGDLSESTLSNIKWGSGVSEAGQTALGSAAAKAESLKTSGDAAAFAKEVAPYLTTAAGSANTVSDGKYVISGLEAGYYLIKDQDKTLDGKEDESYTSYILEVVKNVTVNPKGDVPESEKKIVEGENKVDANEASIGDTVNYEITGTLPTNFADYNTYYYVFTDTLSKGLTYKNNVKVEIVNGETATDVTQYFYVSATEYSETTGTTITVGIQDIKALNLLKDENENTIVTVTKDSKIVITYSAALNENAVIAGAGNPNDVKLDYSNDPNNSGDGTTTPPSENPQTPPTTSHPTGVTPKDEVVTYTTELTILKKDGEGKVLPNVEFTLTGNGVKIVLVTTEKFTEAADGEYWKLKDGTYTTTAPTIADDETDNSADYDSTATKYSKTIEIVAKGEGKTETSVIGVIDEGGHVTFTGLGAGTYTITETKTPAGYNTIDPITFTITFNAETKTFVSDNANVVVGADNKLDTTIINNKGAELPSTGGMGTTIFYILGGVLVLAAVVLLVTKKRMNAEK